MPNKDGTGPNGTFINCQPKNSERPMNKSDSFCRRGNGRGRMFKRRN